MHISTKKNVNVNKLIGFVKEKANVKFSTVGSWMLIAGLPNVGKSTIINSLRKRAEDIEHSKRSGAKVGALPCITKSISGFKIMTQPQIYVLDTPGIIMPKIEEESEQGLKLSAVQSIRDGILESELVCDYVLFKLN